MAAQDLTIEKILPLQLDAAAAVALSQHDRHAVENRDSSQRTRLLSKMVEMVPLVSMSAAADEAHIRQASVIETVPVTAARLSDQRERASRRMAGWERFVAVRCDSQQAAAMHPVLLPGSVAVIDRHYNSLAPYHADEPTLLAVRYGTGLLLRYVDFEDGRLILRPAALSCAVQLVPIAGEMLPGHCIAGRVCMVFHGV